MALPPLTSVFFAYSGNPRLHAETMRDAIAATKNRGLTVQGWEDLAVSGKVLIESITTAIDSADAVVAEISSTNPNVLFEAGYALGRNKALYLAIDETDQDATRAWAGLALVDTIGRVNYTGNSEVLANQLADSMATGTVPLLESFLAGAKPREENAIFAPGVPHKFDAAMRLERLLERKTDLNLIGAQDELGLAGLSYYVQDIYRSSAVILHFMKPSRQRANEYNSRLSLLAGIAHGFDLPLLMLAEPGYEPPLDYKDMLYRYRSIAALTEKVDSWLKTLPTPPGSNRRLGKLKLDIELPVRTFGQYVAESEKDSLSEYFVHTNEFEAVLSGRAPVFTGRKGTGKTASMQQAVNELGKDRRVLVAPIKPSSYDLADLVQFLDRFEETSKREYFLLNLWSFLLVSEISIHALTYAEKFPAGVGGDHHTEALAQLMSELGVNRDGDLAARLDEVISKADQMTLEELAGTLRVRWHKQLLPKLRPVLNEYDRIAVLIDNLDKTWERGVNFERLSHFLLSLLVTSGKLQAEFDKAAGPTSTANVTLTIFLRTDIFDVMKEYAREPDKINPQAIQWHDEELLIRVLEERYAANRLNGKKTAGSLWVDVFCPEVHGLATRDYFLWRALPRPRDIIFLGNSALTTAINRRHEKVLSQDFDFAETVYSRFAVEALLVESEAQGFDLEEVLIEFAGLESTISSEQLDEVLDACSADVKVKDWLVRTSFLGVEARDGRFTYVEGESDARKKLRAAVRLADRLRRPLQFRVHPAFRPYLDIRDDDVHQIGI